MSSIPPACTQTSLNDLSDLPLSLVIEFLGPNASFARTCRRFRLLHEDYINILRKIGLTFVRDVNRQLWKAMALPEILPEVGQEITLKQIWEVHKATTKVVREIWKSFTPKNRQWFGETFRTQDTALISGSAALFESLIHADLHKLARILTVDRTDQKSIFDFLKENAEKISISEAIFNLKAIYHLTDGYIDSVPVSFGLRLRNISVLNLSNNQLTSVPYSLGFLEELISLNLSSNKLTSVPEEIGALHKLRVLKLDGNLLRDLPKSFSTIRDLLSVSISHNLFEQIPLSLTNLRLLDITGNPLRIDEKLVRFILEQREHGCKIQCDDPVEKTMLTIPRSRTKPTDCVIS